MKVPFLIIGGGLSGLAAAIRYARYSPEVLLLEKHSRIGGLNSYYYRNKTLLETGLHAVTNYAEANDKKAPINRLFRQLKLKRKDLKLHPQIRSEIVFENQCSLAFSNDFALFSDEVATNFPSSFSGFEKMIAEIKEINPFLPSPYVSAKQFIHSYVKNDLLTQMILCPLMYYGSSVQNDMDLNQFVIMFRSIFLEGMFRPAGNIKTFLDGLVGHYKTLGGRLRFNAGVKRIITKGKTTHGVELENGEIIECDGILSTVGYLETLHLLGEEVQSKEEPRLGFLESVYLLDNTDIPTLPNDRTITFFNTRENLQYAQPDTNVDYTSGVICFPYSFQGRPREDHLELRTTHLANYKLWQDISANPERYKEEKIKASHFSAKTVEKIIGKFSDHIVYRDTFTPLTIERFTSKIDGAIYGSPKKVKDGDIGYTNLYLAGTDQGFLGIIGSMLSGVSMVNQHFITNI